MAPRAPLADPELFAVDSAGSASVRNAVLTEYNQGGVSRRRKGALKPLKAAQIIAERDAATRPALNVSETRMSKRKREAEGGISRQLKRKLNSLANRQSGGQGLWGVTSTARPNELSHAAKASGTYDAWSVDAVEEAAKAAIPEDIRQAVAKPKPREPRSLRRHHLLDGGKPNPVAMPHPGTSYNPTQNEHQQLLRSALDEAEVDEARRQAEQAARERIEKVRAQERNQELWQQAENDVDKREALSEAEEDDSEAKPEKRQTKRKTEKAKRKAALNRRAEGVARQQRLQAKAERQALAALPGVSKVARRAAAKAEATRLAREERKVTALAERGLAGKPVGAGKAPKAVLDYQISDELAEGLRSLKPEGSLWRDWSGSATRRGMVEAPRLRSTQQRKQKGRSLKVTEKHTWRTWQG